jgi:capsular exopolysaccharide synthesis family protein
LTAEYRHIKRGLLEDISSHKASRMMLIASALPGEGKSYTAANLAVSLALEPDYTVLLVDADVIKPFISRRFGLAGQPGLMDAAANADIDVESLVVTTSIEGFSILPAGRAHPNATEHFASARMHEIIGLLLAVPNRLIVVDSLPLLLTTEARVLVPLAGQVVLVVRAEVTPQNAVLQAIELLGPGANAKLVLNAVERTRVLDYFGYGYGYGYTYNYDETRSQGASGRSHNE